MKRPLWEHIVFGPLFLAVIVVNEIRWMFTREPDYGKYVKKPKPGQWEGL